MIRNTDEYFLDQFYANFKAILWKISSTAEKLTRTYKMIVEKQRFNCEITGSSYSQLLNEAVEGINNSADFYVLKFEVSKVFSIASCFNF